MYILTEVRNRAFRFSHCYRKRFLKSQFASPKYFSSCSENNDCHRWSSMHRSTSLSVLSTISPLGILHVGNYFGALKQCINLQNEGHSLTVCIADLQALNSNPPQNARAVQDAVLITAATLLACGIDPERSTIVQQSKVAGHAQLDWILHSLLSRDDPGLIPIQSKRFSGVKEVTLGQYVQPLLLCADTLLYKANCVPAGEDFGYQNEFNCQTASLFNKRYGECFPLPRAFIDTEQFSSNIRNLRKPLDKMSRLVPDPKSRIEILDTPDSIREKCKKAVTDFTSEVYFDQANRPGVANLMALHSLVTGKDYETISNENSALETARYKFIVSDALNEYFGPIRDKVNDLLRNKTQISAILECQSAKAREKAAETMQDVYQRIGFQSEKMKQYSKYCSPSTSDHLASSSSCSCSSVKPETFRYSPEAVESSRQKVIFSGIQPTGVLHLGNYFGAVRQWVSLQDAMNDVTVCVVDQHAITVPQDPETLNSNVLTMAASILACGIDPEQSVLFQQSRVPQHTQLNAVLRSVTTMALLSRQAHFKDKVSALNEAPSLGLFAYPVLQAADILLYNASHVPVGDDQKQHIQVASHVANNFNKKFGPIFRLPKAMILDDTQARLKSLHKPLKKMSKSESDSNSRIEILDSPERIFEKIKGAVVGSIDFVGDGPDVHPGVTNLMAIHCIVTGTDMECILQEYVGVDVADYKLLVADAVIEHLNPIRRKAEQLLGDQSSLMMILDEGADRAKTKAEKTLQIVHDKVGFLYQS